MKEKREQQAKKKEMYRPYLHRVCFTFHYGYCEDTEYGPPLTGVEEEEDAWFKRWNNYLTLACLRNFPRDTTILKIVDCIEQGVVKVYMTSRAFARCNEGYACSCVEASNTDSVKVYLEGLNNYE